MSQQYIEKLETSLVKVVETPGAAGEPEVVETYTEAKESIAEREQAAKAEFKMLPVKSNNIKFVGYDKKSKQMRVQFTNGGLYQYADVPSEVYEEMINSESAGTFFSKNIRNNYQTTNLSNTKAKESV